MIAVHFERDPNAGVHLIAKMLKCTRIDRMTNKNRTEFIAEIVVSIPKMWLSVCVCVCVYVYDAQCFDVIFVREKGMMHRLYSLKNRSIVFCSKISIHYRGKMDYQNTYVWRFGSCSFYFPSLAVTVYFAFISILARKTKNLCPKCV